MRLLEVCSAGCSGSWPRWSVWWRSSSCVTVILLPLGLPLLAQARRMSTHHVRLMLPPAVAHPVKTMDKSASKSRPTPRTR